MPKPRPKKADSLSAALAASFKSSPPIAPKVSVAAVVAETTAQTVPAGDVFTAGPFEGLKKTTVSLYPTDQELVDSILDALQRSRRHRGGFSDAVKIALRLCPKDDAKIGEAWEKARAEDKRRRK